VSFAVGFTHTCAIRTDSTLWCWGGNEMGQLGHGSQTLASGGLPLAQVVELGANVAQVSAGNMYTCALKKDGTAWCWGQNGDGWLGIGRTSAYEQRPAQVATLGTDVVQISAENQGTCAIKKDATVWCWWGSPDDRDAGSNAGPIGVNPLLGPPSPPVQTANLSGISQISTGRRVASALKSDGTLWTWGPAISLGRTTASGPIPGHVTALGSTVTQVSNRYRHMCARTNDGALWCWGDTSHGSLGNGQGYGSTLPVKVLTTCN
jgi:alpha-tubulin suppressor-like RCC1 family protein